ncbi:S-adenosyl-L-methionine-dependent methyltransferase [Thelephora ganbajun]|uniref:S-adenosyl-L-methionine-dependent methyltransferase n=1 Tax=Thelephora ganbajun TaxID=370292 RepID=A0ACB6Z2H3_THEGA|nr:S-adenosyl-L-methionine-dependent methyltransferase [Thelephora ganbajun]
MECLTSLCPQGSQIHTVRWTILTALQHRKTHFPRESDGGSFDWFKSYSDISYIIHELVPDKSARILMLGCGNSRLSEEMYDDGYKNITNVDYSSVVIDQMQRRHMTLRPGMEWMVADVRELPFTAGTFDVALDKGTMDAMMTTKGDVWDPPEQAIRDCNREVDDALRVLSPTGLFLYLTFGQPHFRKRYLSKRDTQLEVRQLGETFHYYFYILRRQ